MQREIRIYGKVQGVFYRASAKQKALELQLTGWVQNEPDGSVLAIADGDAIQMELFMEWCKEGPAGANVTEVQIKKIDFIAPESFEIRR